MQCHLRLCNCAHPWDDISAPGPFLEFFKGLTCITMELPIGKLIFSITTSYAGVRGFATDYPRGDSYRALIACLLYLISCFENYSFKRLIAHYFVLLFCNQINLKLFLLIGLTEHFKFYFYQVPLHSLFSMDVVVTLSLWNILGSWQIHISYFQSFLSHLFQH